MAESIELQVLVAAIQNTGGWGEGFGATQQISVRLPVQTLVTVEAMAEMADYERSKMLRHLLDTAVEIVRESLNEKAAEKLEEIENARWAKIVKGVQEETKA